MSKLDEMIDKHFQIPCYRDFEIKTLDNLYELIDCQEKESLDVTSKFDFADDRDHAALAHEIANRVLDNNLFTENTVLVNTYISIVTHTIYELGRRAGAAANAFEIIGDTEELESRFLRVISEKMRKSPDYDIPKELTKAIQKKHGKETGRHKGLLQRESAKQFMSEQLSKEPNLSINELARRTVKDSILHVNKYGVELKNEACKAYARSVKSELKKVAPPPKKGIRG